MTELRLRQLAAFGVLLLALAAYWPAVDNPFIADDYALLLGAERAAEHCTALFAMPLGGRRLVSNFFFTVCFALFGADASLFYWGNLVLHVVNSLLVVHLVRAVAGNWRAAVAAGLFFVAYERHQEPVFWIGASHELLLALGVLATTYAFVRYRQSGRRGWYALALAAFVFSVFAKESFLVIPPLLVLADWCVGQGSWRERWQAHAPFWLATAAYVALMYVGPWPYPFGETQSGLTPHFFGVYLRSLNRLLLFVYGFFALAWIVSRLKKEPFTPALRLLAPSGAEGRPFLFFFVWLLVTIVPYSFILYEQQLSSRHTYIPSVATAALVGLLFAFLWEQARSRSIRLAWAAVLAVCLAVNVAYVWKKDAQYIDRAESTEQLILWLNGSTQWLDESRSIPWLGPGSKVVVYDFPYPAIVGRGAVRFFTTVDPHAVVFRWKNRPKPTPPASLTLIWDPTSKMFRYVPLF